MSNKIYGRIVDGILVEYPVYLLHIQNRANPIEWYTEASFEDMPVVPPYHYAREIVKVKDDKIIVSYECLPIKLDALLADINREVSLPLSKQASVNVADLDQDLVARVIVLIKELAQKALDDFAKSKDFDNILAAISYKDSSEPSFAADAVKAVTVRDQTWVALHSYLQDVTNGTQPVPASESEVLSKLPPLAW
jgi:hypothetical protein